jgi:sugar porter (SP) family MFS transporter
MANAKVFIWSLVVALGGFLFGFDTAVISGAEKDIQSFWQLNVFEHGLTVSIALIGTVLGALLGGIPSDRLGRKKTLFWIGVLYFVSAVGSAVTTGWWAFLFFRLIGGFGVGASSVTAPLYISEISPAGSRGKLVAMFQFNVVFGILVSYLSNYLLAGIGDNDWRWMLGVEAIPALVFLLAVLGVPESPRWLIVKRGKTEEARAVLALANPPGTNVDRIVADIAQSAEQAGNARKTVFFSRPYFRPISLAFLFAFFNQVSGINAIIYYAPRIFGLAGLTESASLLSSAGIGLVNLVFTLVGLNLIDRVGRRTLMLVGSVGLIVTLGLVAYAFYNNQSGYAVPVYLFAYIAFFAFSQGAVIWVFISEIFPNEVRADGQALGSFTHWFMAAVIAFTFPYIAETLGGGNTFLFFCAMMVLQLLFVWRMMPETKGTSLEQIGRNVVMH